MKSDSKFIVVASDGIWDYMSNEEVVEIVLKQYELSGEISDVVDNLVSVARDSYIKVGVI